MKAIVTVRTRNEARNIARFCQAHAWADLILVADGGSKDNTLDLARMYQNVKVAAFRERIQDSPTHWHNPHGRHINFLIDWALSEGADWLIFDDCDCVPTQALQRDIRGLLEDTDKQVIELYRLYVWGQREYFPDLNEPGTSLWGWHKDAPIRAMEPDPHPHHHEMTKWEPETALRLTPPHAALHYFSPDEATVQRKLNYYRSIEVAATHPLEACGKLEKLPDWAKWR